MLDASTRFVRSGRDLVVACVLLSVVAGGCAQAPTVDDSQPAPEPTDIANLMVSCLQEAGWPAELVDGGFTIVDDPRTDIEQQQAVESCLATLRENGVLPSVEPLTEEQLKDRYEYLVAMRECLLDEGYALPAPPSLVSFVDSFGNNWTPFAQLPDVSGGELDRLNEVCPQAGP